MTQEEMIELAKQAGFLTNEIKSYVISPYTSEDQDLYQELEAFAKLVAEHEREMCAKVCDDELKKWGIFDSDIGDVSKAIRARGNNEN